MSSSQAPCNKAWLSLIDKLQKLDSFRIHTGNVNNYVELKLKRYKNSAEELIACLDLQFANLKADIDLSNNGMLLLAEPQPSDTDYERDDLKITLKVFLESFTYSHIQDSVEAVLSQLKTENIEQLIVAFPQPESGDETNVDQEWLQNVLRIWNELEQMVASEKVVTVGVADFQLSQLKALYEAASLKPVVDHFNIEACCVVPPELQAFAKEKDIQLLTHNDPYPFPLKDVFKSFCHLSTSSPACAPAFEPTWASRYTVWVRRRSLMAAKGYIVQFARTKDAKKD
ncbi:Protein E01A2.1 a [Aphelenchoides avenae]|nr:Protein E01A2.1 a [Aphelenchus avenae]